MKIRILFILLLLASVAAQSQGLSFLKKWNESRIEKRETRWSQEKIYKQHLLGMGFQFTQNQNFSQNQYPGFLLSLRGAKTREATKKLYVFDKNINAGVLNLRKSLAPTYSINTRFSHSVLWKTNPYIAFGSQFSAVFNGRVNLNNENNAVLMEAMLDLAPRVRAKRDIKILGDVYGVEYHLAVPLAGFGYLAPSFNTSFDDSNLKGLFFLNKYQRVQSELLFILPAGKRFPNKNFKAGYHWDFMHIDLGNNLNLYNAVHTVSFIGSLHKIK